MYCLPNAMSTSKIQVMKYVANSNVLWSVISLKKFSMKFCSSRFLKNTNRKNYLLKTTYTMHKSTLELIQLEEIVTSENIHNCKNSIHCSRLPTITPTFNRSNSLVHSFGRQIISIKECRTKPFLFLYTGLN